MNSPASPLHHAPPEALLEAVTGGLDPAIALAVDCHVSFCARCLAEQRRLAAIGGALLEAEPGQPLAPGALERVLARLDDAPPAARPAGAEAAQAAQALERLLEFEPPAPLARALAGLAHPRWRYVAPGTGGIDVPLPATTATAQLLRLRPGLRVPPHDHDAVEATVILSGALVEGEERFGRGDILVRGPGERHQQAVERPEICIAVVVNAGRLVPLTLKGRLLKLVARP
jgi:putative transcriptional regulator